MRWETVTQLVRAGLAAGVPQRLLLEGPPGTGKTWFARQLAGELGAEFFQFSAHPEAGRELWFAPDLDGMVRGERGTQPGPATQAILASREGFAVLLIDEVDKAGRGFEASLLHPLQYAEVADGEGRLLKGNAAQLVVILTSNGRRPLLEETLRRMRRVYIPRPRGAEMEELVLRCLPPALRETVPAGLINLLVRVGDFIWEQYPDEAPAPQELAGLATDLVLLRDQLTYELVAELAPCWLVKTQAEAERTLKAVPFDWRRALLTEVRRGA